MRGERGPSRSKSKHSEREGSDGSVWNTWHIQRGIRDTKPKRWGHRAHVYD